MAVASGIVAGALEACIAIGAGPLALPPWNAVVLVLLGSLGGGLLALPVAALTALPVLGPSALTRRVRLHLLAPTGLLASLAPWLLSSASSLLLPAWAPPPSVAWWVLAVALALLPAAALAPSGALRVLAVCVPLVLAGLQAVPPASEDAPDTTAVLVTVDGLRADALDPDGPLLRTGRRWTTLTASPHARAANHILAEAVLGRDPRTAHASCAPTLADSRAVDWPESPIPRRDGTAAFVSSDLVGNHALPGLPVRVHDDDPSLVQGLDRIALGRLTRALGLWRRPAGRDANYTIDAAIAWASQQEEPFRLWVHLRDPVGPYVPGDPWDKRFIPADDPRSGPDRLAPWRPLAPEHGDTLDDIHDPAWVDAQYRGEVAKVEYQIARLVAALPEGTPILVVGTHGEALGEDGRRWRHDGLGPGESLVPVVAIGSVHEPDPAVWRADALAFTLLQGTAHRHGLIPRLELTEIGDAEGEPAMLGWDGEVLVRVRADAAIAWGADGELWPDPPDGLVSHARQALAGLTRCAGPAPSGPLPDPWTEHVFRLGGSVPAAPPPRRAPEDLP